MGQGDDFDLERFVEAQSGCYARALGELHAGAKRTHWIWFVFPQLKGLGFSENAIFYGLASRAEASAYLGHPLLGPRLRECVRTLLASKRGDIREIMGSPDDMKLCSSMTLFGEVASDAADGALFGAIIDRFYGGRRDAATLKLLAEPGR